MGGVLHVAVTETVHFMEYYVFVTVEPEHTHEIGVFLIAPVEFEFAVSGDDEHWSSITANEVERCQMIDCRSEFRDALFAPLCKVGDYLTAIRNEGCYLFVRVDAIFSKIFGSSAIVRGRFVD